MSIPDWQDTTLGTMKRAALWLITVVGEGNTFTKEDVIKAFPGVSQADRRVRDLRDFGWQIDTNREDVNLDQHKLRFIKPGDRVWEPGKGSRPGSKITHTRRREVLANDGHFCRSCGITPGETYEGSYESAQLDLARRGVKQLDGTEVVELVSECKRCRVGGAGKANDIAVFLGAVQSLGALERQALAGWVEADRREFSVVERLWADYRTLPSESRAKVRQALGLGD
ncbi:hypothetical protein ACFTXJ_09770 [Streptomyces zhihengii]|uniref:hypothetical protein n=1 Tax=Streptomyces zhihengii TaxID=1818004 RepID=UPI0036395864